MISNVKFSGSFFFPFALRAVSEDFFFYFDIIGRHHPCIVSAGLCCLYLCMFLMLSVPKPYFVA
jgi:hypothetical protein